MFSIALSTNCSITIIALSLTLGCTSQSTSERQLGERPTQSSTTVEGPPSNAPDEVDVARPENFLHSFQFHNDPIKALTYSQDGTQLAAVDSTGKIGIWQVDDATATKLDETSVRGSFFDIAITADMQFVIGATKTDLLTGDAPSVFVWDRAPDAKSKNLAAVVAKGRVVRKLDPTFESLQGVVLSPNGKQVLAFGQPTAIIWQIEDLEESIVDNARRVPANDNSCTAAAFVGDQHVRLCKRDGVYDWNLDDDTLQQIVEFDSQRRMDMAVQISPDGQNAAVVNLDSTIPAMLPFGRQRFALQAPAGEGRYFFSEVNAFSMSGDLYAAPSNQGAVQIWNSETGKRVQLLDGTSFVSGTEDERPIRGISIRSDSQRAATGTSEGEILIWSLESP